MTRIAHNGSDLLKIRNDTILKTNFRCDPISFEDQDRWALKDGAISHVSGGFFHVLGVKSECVRDEGVILYQPQSAVTGLLLSRRENGACVCLQARAEPGNTGIVQFGPTIQSTAANYMKLHGGRDTEFLAHFQSHTGDGSLLSYSMQTDLGDLYFQKSKTHTYVETDELSEAGGHTVWASIISVVALTGHDYLLNTDLRSLIAMFDWDHYCTGERYETEPNTELLAAYFRKKGEGVGRHTLCRIDDLNSWSFDAWGLRQLHQEGRHVGLFSVQARTREVDSWVQPLLVSQGLGYVCLYRCVEHDEPEYLVQVLSERGINGGAIIAPSELVYPGGDTSDIVVHGQPFRHFMHSEEGGRFAGHESRFEVRNVSADFELSSNHFWVTARQLKQLFMTSNTIAIQLRVISSIIVDELNPKAFRPERSKRVSRNSAGNHSKQLIVSPA